MNEWEKEKNGIERMEESMNGWEENWMMKVEGSMNEYRVGWYLTLTCKIVYSPDENDFRTPTDGQESAQENKEECQKREERNEEGKHEPKETMEKLDKVYKAEERLSMLMAGLDQEMLEKFGHQFNDMIRSCTFKGVDCRLQLY